MGGWWRQALVSPDGVAPSRMVSVSASVNLPLHHKVQTFSRKKGRKTVVDMSPIKQVFYAYVSQLNILVFI